MAKAREIPDLHGTDDFQEAAIKVVSVRADELWEQAGGVLDVGDIERVHSMRVATRRLRAVLEIFAPCFPHKPHSDVLRDVKDLADALGERRDPDVQIEHLEAYERPSRPPTGPGSRSSCPGCAPVRRRPTRISPSRWPGSSAPTCAGACARSWRGRASDEGPPREGPRSRPVAR